MSLQDRLAALITAIGADIKALQASGGFIAGVGPPTNAVGATGDFYVDLLTQNVYGPKVAMALGDLTGMSGQLHPNPSVEANTNNWSVSASAGGGTSYNERTTDHPQDGLYAYHGRVHRINSAVAVNQVNTQGSTAGTGLSAVDPTKVYSFSMRVYTRENSMTGGGRIRVYWYKSDGSASSISTNSLAPSPGTPFVVGQTTQHNFENVTPPSDAAYCRTTMYVGANANPGDNAWEGDVDSVVMVQASTVPKWGPVIGSMAIAAATGATLVTSLPGSPTDGQEVYYVADGTNGVIWHLRYRAASSKWEFVGGGSLYAEDLAVRASINNSPSYGALATGLSLTAPLAGTYEVEYGVSVVQTGTTANVGFFTDVNVAGSGANDTNGAHAYMNAQNIRQAVHKKRRITCAAGDVVALVHKSSQTTINAHARTLSLKPIQVS